MANGNNPKQRKKARPNFSDFQFCDIRLTKEDKKEFEQWATANAPDAFDLLDSLVNSGVKMSYSWSDANDCYTVSFTDLEEKSQNYQVVLVSRADNFQEALMIGLYKHYVVCDQGLWPVKSQESDWG